MLVVTRLRVSSQDNETFQNAAREALVLLSQRAGYLAGDLGRAADDPDLWLLCSRWTGAGAYRRALSAYDSKLALAPLMAFVVDEPSAYDVVVSVPATDR